jgi:hypothetical protein
MKKVLTIFTVLQFIASQLTAQTEPSASKWKPWFISSVGDYRMPAPSSYKEEIAQVISKQQHLDSARVQQMLYWNAGAPGYHWHEMMNKLWQVDTSRYGVLANLLLGTAIYDATIASWDTKYAYKRVRPFEADKRIKVFSLKPESPSYPCEYSVAAGVAVTIFSKFYPLLADSVKKLAQELMNARVAAGLAFPSDTRAGFELGKKVAEKEIEYTREFITTAQWDGKFPQQANTWKGKPMAAVAGQNKTVVLSSGSEFRPGPPPDFTNEMAELKNYKQTFRSQANAFYWATQDFWSEALNKKIFEYNLHMNPPKAALLYATVAVAAYDGFIACWDAKYTYWGTRPNQYDTSYRSLVPTPPFPGYPSGHALMSGMFSELYSYFFPLDAAFFQKKAKDAAESRFQAGIHFRTDNEVGLSLGRKVAAAIVQKLKQDGVGNTLVIPGKNLTGQKPFNP